MNELHIVSGNRLEMLAERLAAQIADPPSPPFSPEVIIVQSRGMQRWVSLELARCHRIMANCRFPFPNAFLYDVYRKMMPGLPETSAFDPGVLTFTIMELLPAGLKRPEFAPLRAYLHDDPSGIKRFQLAGKIADVFDQYLVFRPEMVFSWEAGHDDHWQAALWRMVVAGRGESHRARLRQHLVDAIQSRHDVPGLPERISLFGISYLPPYHLQVFAALARRVPVTLFVMTPCREYWADILSGKEIRRIRAHYPSAPAVDRRDLHMEEGNRLLASLGTMGRDFFTRISAFDADSTDAFEDPGEGSLLSCIQSDILNLRQRANAADGRLTGASADRSVQIHSAHSPMREIEVLHDSLLDMFEADPGLLAKDILIMTPDIESYAPYIQAVFESGAGAAPRIPFSIADRGLKQESRLIDAFWALLDLIKNGRMGALQVLTLLEYNAIRECFKLAPDEVDMAGNWISATRIRWGFDAESRSKAGQPPFRENTWQAGIQRLLLGVAMPEEDGRMFSDVLPYGAIEGRDASVLGRLLAFVESLQAFSTEIGAPRRLDAWHLFLKRLLETFLLPDGSSEREWLLLRRIVDTLAVEQDVSGFDEVLDFEVIRSYLKGRIDNAAPGYGFIAGGVTFCAMLPMRSIPFKVIGLVGMNSEAFPRQDRAPGFDLIAGSPVPGDRLRRNDDKYLFLEALISARDIFYISFVGRSIQDNSPIPPSVMVSELVDYISGSFPIDPAGLIRRHPLQAFSPVYFREKSPFFSYSEENRRACGRLLDPGRGAPGAFVPAALPASPAEREAWRRVNLDDLVAFFSNPSRYLLQRRLGMDLGEAAHPPEDRESFSLDPLEQYLLGQDLLEQARSGGDLKAYQAVERARGRLPHGSVGEVWYADLCAAVESFLDRVAPLCPAGQRLDDLAVDLTISGFRISGRVSDICTRGRVVALYANEKPKYIIKTWIKHLFMNASVDKNKPYRSHLVLKDSWVEFRPPAHGRERDILADLLAVYESGQVMPLLFFPESSYEYACQVLQHHKSESEALRGASRKWDGHERGEKDDPYYRQCFGRLEKADIFGRQFQELALKVLEPLLAHMERTYPAPPR